MAESFKPGDRVKFTGKHPGFANNHRIGWEGVVTAANVGNITVKWDEGGVSSHYPTNLEKLNSRLWSAVEELASKLAAGNGVSSAVTGGFVSGGVVTLPNLKKPSPGADAVDALREQADRAEEMSDALSELSEKLNDAADALEAVNGIAAKANTNKF